MSWARKVGVTALVVLVAIQFIPVGRTNPKTDPRQSIYATLAVPSNVKEVFQRSCQNCHTNETVWPWYSHVAPVSWMIARDVHQARKAMNLSEWGSYSQAKRTDKLEEICEQVTNGDMPDRKYMLIHRRAHPTPQERDAVCQWSDDSREY